MLAQRVEFNCNINFVIFDPLSLPWRFKTFHASSQKNFVLKFQTPKPRTLIKFSF